MGGNGHVLLPVAVVGVTVLRRVFDLRRNGSDPDGCEAHVLDVVQLFSPLAVFLSPKGKLSECRYLLDDSLPCTTTVLPGLRIARLLGRAISAGESVRQQEVDGLRFPFRGGCCQGRAQEQRPQRETHW